MKKALPIDVKIGKDLPMKRKTVKEHKRQINFRFDPKLLKQLGDASEKTGMTKTKILERALIQYLSFKDLPAAIKKAA